MTIYHKHHIVPRHMGGPDDASNIVKLTVEEHAEAHLELYQEHGLMQDLVAHRMLLGQIDKAEAIKILQKAPKSERWKKNMSERIKGEGNPMWGKSQTKKQKEAVRIANSVPKPYVSDNMKKRHENDESYVFSERDSSKGGQATHAKKPKWWTNGTDNKYIPEAETPPEGYCRGRTTGWKTRK